jgi:DNA-binding NtrC family response regulator
MKDFPMSPCKHAQGGSPAVLVVDDDPTFCDFMAEALTRAGYSVETAENGRRALQLLDKGGFDAVVTDIYMPQADAIDLVREMHRRCANLPVVLVTGNHVGQTPVLHFLRTLGVTQVLPKPFGPDRLQQAVADALAKPADDGTQA